MEFREHVLPNGLEVVAECNPEAHSMALGFFVKTGARDETDDVAGVSHFLEHMVFKGTPTRSADDVNREFDEMGAHYNAFTSEEKTVYYAAVLPEYQRPAVATAGRHPAALAARRRLRHRKESDPGRDPDVRGPAAFGADDACRAMHFGHHPLGHSVLGTVESVGDLPVEAMRDYFRRRYSPGNIALVAAGQVDFDALVAAAGECCGGWEPFDDRPQRRAGRAARGLRVRAQGRPRSSTSCRLPTAPAATDDDRFAAKLLATILGDDSGSRLFWELVDPGLAEHASLGHYEYQGTGHVHDLPQLRARAGGRQFAARARRSIARSRPTA